MMAEANTIIISIKEKGELERYVLGKNLKEVTELEIEGPMSDEDVVLLGKYVRSNTNITKVNLSKVQELTSIDHNAFEKCYALSNITFPSGIQRIGDHAFDSCTSIHAVELPSSIEIVGDRAFCKCENLETINIPSKTSYIGVGAFYGCYKLTSINVEGENPRYECKEGVLFDNVDKTLLRYIQPKQLEKTFKTPKSVIHIGNYAFDGCKGLVKVEVNEGCTDLGERSFTRCNDLVSITLPSSTNNLNYNAFDDCDALEEIIVDENNETFKSYNGVLYTKDMQTLKICPKSKKSPFFFHEEILKIDEGAFSGCKNIKTVVLPGKIETIGAKAFYNCESLEFVNIPNSLKLIGDFGFANCKKLQKVRIYCSQPPKCGVSPFASVNTKECQIYVPIDSEMLFRKDYGWDSFENINESLNLTLGSNFSFIRNVGLKIKRFFISLYANKAKETE